jgi:hypothetical protein
MVVLYSQLLVKVNYAYRKDELTETAVRQIIGDLATILPKR